MKKEDIHVVIIVMEYGMHGTSVRNHDGSTTIFLNARDSYEQRLKAYRHELGHDEDEDFEKVDVQEIERDAHRKER